MITWFNLSPVLNILILFLRQKVLNLIYPFEPTIWLMFMGSLFIFGATFTYISKVEGKLIGWNLREWNTYYEAFWYAYGTFIGEAVTRDTRSDKAKALRIAIIVWIVYCFLMSSGYCGTLRSFLINPTMNKPINTLEEVQIIKIVDKSSKEKNIDCLNFAVGSICSALGIWSVWRRGGRDCCQE